MFSWWWCIQCAQLFGHYCKCVYDNGACRSALEEERQRRSEAVEALRVDKMAAKTRPSEDKKMTSELERETKRRREAEKLAEARLQQTTTAQQQLTEEAQRMATITAHQSAALENTRRALETEKQLCDELKRWVEQWNTSQLVTVKEVIFEGIKSYMRAMQQFHRKIFAFKKTFLGLSCLLKYVEPLGSYFMKHMKVKFLHAKVCFYNTCVYVCI